MKNNLAAFVFKTGLFLVPIVLLFEVLFRLGYYPVITNSTVFDKKVIQLQKLHIKKLKVLGLGSSITLYGLNSQIMVQNFGTSYYNFGSWSLQMGDLKYMMNSYIDAYHPEYVIMCSSITEFVFPRNDKYFNYLDASTFVKNNLPEYFYLKNYSSIHQIVYRKVKSHTLAIDAWGGTSLTVKSKDIDPQNWNRRNIMPTRYTAQNYTDLDTLCSVLKAHNIKLIFIQSPIKADYANTAAAKQILTAHFDKCRAIVKAHGGMYLNYYNPAIFTDSLFIDPCHLQAAGGVVLSKLIVHDLKSVIK